MHLLIWGESSCDWPINDKNKCVSTKLSPHHIRWDNPWIQSQSSSGVGISTQECSEWENWNQLATNGWPITTNHIIFLKVATCAALFDGMLLRLIWKPSLMHHKLQGTSLTFKVFWHLEFIDLDMWRLFWKPLAWKYGEQPLWINFMTLWHFNPLGSNQYNCCNLRSQNLHSF